MNMQAIYSIVISGAKITVPYMLTTAFWLILISLLFVGVIVTGVAASAYQWRWLYEGISERMHIAHGLLQEGRCEEAEELLSDH